MNRGFIEALIISFVRLVNFNKNFLIINKKLKEKIQIQFKVLRRHW